MIQYCGVDCGYSGAIGVIHGEAVKIYDMPVREYINSAGKKKRDYSIAGIRCLVQEIERQGPCHFVLETVSSRPGQGTVSSGSLYRGFAIWETVLVCHGFTEGVGYPYYKKVHPSTWKHVMVPDGGDFKVLSVNAALGLFPQAAQYFKLKKHHDRSEALLLAEWGRRNSKGVS